MIAVHPIPAGSCAECSSGEMRADDAMLAWLQLQSASDQQDLPRYPVIAVAAPAAMPPEQAGPSARWPRPAAAALYYPGRTRAGAPYCSGRLRPGWLADDRAGRHGRG